MSVRSVIFDCFGVLTNDGWLKFREEFLVPGSAADDEAIELNRQADAGLITSQEFIKGIARLGATDENTVKAIVGTHAINDKLFEYIADELKPQYLIGMLSNAPNDVSYLFTAEQNAVFDATLISYEIGVTKPHEAMYLTIATRLGVLPEECVFIDDREGFVIGAREVGMRSFRYENLADCREKLAEMLD